MSIWGNNATVMEGQAAKVMYKWLLDFYALCNYKSTGAAGLRATISAKPTTRMASTSSLSPTTFTTTVSQ